MLNVCLAQGVFVLTDEAFRPFSRMSAEAGGQVVVRAQPVRRFLSLLPVPAPPRHLANLA